MDESYSTYEDFLNNDGSPDDLHISYAYLLFIQVYSLLLYHLHWLSDLDYGRKGRERRRRRKPFDEGVASKLSDYFFRRIYRMTRASFDHLHSILEPQLQEIVFLIMPSKETLHGDSRLEVAPDLTKSLEQ